MVPFFAMLPPNIHGVFKKYSEECISIIIDNKPEICEEYSIEYYPTVILFRKGKVSRRLDARPGIGLD